MCGHFVYKETNRNGDGSRLVASSATQKDYLPQLYNVAELQLENLVISHFS